MFRCSGVPGCYGVFRCSEVFRCSGMFPVFRGVPVFLVLVHAVQNLLFSRIPYYQNVYVVGLTLNYKKFCMGLFSLGVLSESISNVEKMYRVCPRRYSTIRVWFWCSTLELWSITHIYTRYSLGSCSAITWPLTTFHVLKKITYRTELYRV